MCKKIIVFLLSLCLSLSFVACSSQQSVETKEENLVNNTEQSVGIDNNQTTENEEVTSNIINKTDYIVNIKQPQNKEEFEEVKLTAIQSLYYYIVSEYPIPVEVLVTDKILEEQLGLSPEYFEEYYGGYSGTKYIQDYCIVFKVKPESHDLVINALNLYIETLKNNLSDKSSYAYKERVDNYILEEHNDTILFCVMGNTYEIEDIGSKSYYNDLKAYVGEGFNLYKVDLLPREAQIEYILK